MNENDSIPDSQRKSASFEALSARYSHIKGWGIDADPQNDPTYPIRHRLEGHRQDNQWDRPKQQANADNILRSNERPSVSSVFGTSAPVAGLSGAIRRCAFKYSESRFRHWLLLLFADRVNVVEGLADDVLQGKVPHCLDERGFNAELKYNQKEVVKRVALGAVVVSSIALLLMRKRH